MRRRAKLAAMVVAMLAGACSTTSDSAQETPDAPRFEQRVGVPVLMDIPLIGWLFSRHTVVR